MQSLQWDVKSEEEVLEGYYLRGRALTLVKRFWELWTNGNHCVIDSKMTLNERDCVVHTISVFTQAFIPGRLFSWMQSWIHERRESERNSQCHEKWNVSSGEYL